MTQNVRDFIRDNHLEFTAEQLEEMRLAFTRDMEAGLSGGKSSLMMLPTYITGEGNAPAGEKVIVLDAGGTNFRVAVCRFTEDGGIAVEYFEKTRMPGSEQPVDVEEFFAEVARKLLPVIDESDKIGVCFSYAAEVLPSRDARIIAINKEVVLLNAEGVLVCEGTARALKRLGVTREKKFVLINDTVAALLGAKAEHGAGGYGDFAGFILGTGTNIAYSERCSAIRKAPELAAQSGSMIINMESGFFDRIPRTDIDIAIDRGTNNPGFSIGEKMISGAYIGETCRRFLALAGEQGVLSEAAGRAFAAMEELPLADIGALLSGEPGALDTVAAPADREAAADIITAVFARAAAIVAAEFAGIFGRGGVDASLPVCVSAEGTTVNRSPIYKPLIIEAVRRQLTDRFGVSIDFVYVEDATLKGTALAAALNC